MPFEDAIEGDGEPNEKRPGYLKIGETVLDRVNEWFVSVGKPVLDPTAVDDKKKLRKELRKIIKIAIKDELQTDPTGKGYAGKTAAQQSVMLVTPQILGPGLEILPGGLYIVLASVPYAPNFFSAAEITDILT